jgi:predicted DCC family thiol-disulfide oxidoreductase YuxK
MVKLFCENCGHRSEVFENEVYDTYCELCGNQMKVDVDKRPAGDNFPQIPQEREMQDSIGTIGIRHTWEMIEVIANVKLRLQYRNLFFKCGGKIPERENDNIF